MGRMRYTERNVGQKIDMFDCMFLGIMTGIGVGIGNDLAETQKMGWPYAVGTYIGVILLLACVSMAHEFTKRLVNKIVGEDGNE